MSAVPELHIISATVENRPGVLARIALLFSRRGFNIFSLAVAPTDDPSTSRVTIVVDAESAPIEQITKQLHKLINVIKINEHPPEASIERELMLATVGVPPEQRSELMALADLFSGQIVDVGHDRLTLMVAGHPDRLDAFEDLIRPYDIVEIQRTGRVALPMLEREDPAARRLRLAG
ncbi:MAG: acetolactate synthase small subunit [Actinomycetota bacterium]